MLSATKGHQMGSSARWHRPAMKAREKTRAVAARGCKITAPGIILIVERLTKPRIQFADESKISSRYDCVINYVSMGDVTSNPGKKQSRKDYIKK